MRGGAGRRVRPHVTPGPIPTSWGLSLSESWLRHMATHLLRRATEELHADGRTGSTPQFSLRVRYDHRNREVLAQPRRPPSAHALSSQTVSNLTTSYRPKYS